MEETLILPMILQIAGFLVIIAEIILPSGGLLSLLAIGVIGYSLKYVYAEVSPQASFYLAMIDIVLIPVLIAFGLKLLEKSSVTLKNRLSKEDGVVSQSISLKSLENQEGTALTDLRPSGTAKISNKRFDVVTRGEYVEKDSKIVVISVTGNQVIVKQSVEES